MRITPLVLHAAARVPALTDLFSTHHPVSSMTVTAGGDVQLTFTAPHGRSTGQAFAICIVDADVPNRVTSMAVTNGIARLGLQHEHDQTSSVGDPGDGRRAWNVEVKLNGFAASMMNGFVQIADIPSRTAINVLPSGALQTTALTGNEVMLERLENGIVGWHRVVATGSNTAVFPTPPEITRSYTVPNPRVVRDVRVAGALNLEVALDSYVAGYETSGQTESVADLGRPWMFITPAPNVILSKDRNAGSDAVAEITPASEYRQLLLDGFHVYVFLPARNAAAAVACSDLANGEVLGAVLRTFHGLVLPRRELYQGDTYVSLLVEHGQARGSYQRAFYVHGYVFQAPAYLTNLDAIQAFEWSRIDESTMTAASGLGPGTLGGALQPSTSITPAPMFALRDVAFGPAIDPTTGQPAVDPVTGEPLPGGIYHDDAPQPLTGIVRIT